MSGVVSNSLSGVIIEIRDIIFYMFVYMLYAHLLNLCPSIVYSSQTRHYQV